MGKKKVKWSPSDHSEKWDEQERKSERTMARGKDDGFRIQWGYNPSKNKKKSVWERLMGK